jgi:membrane associated rhomboid family serine protease
MISLSTETDFFIIRVSSGKEFKEIELLLLSRTIPFTVRADYRMSLFYIPLSYETFASAELRTYLEENKNWPLRETTDPTPGFRFSMIHIWVILCLAFFHWQITRIDANPRWLEIGRFIATNVLAGDWWRLFTALTLHADDAHLLSNMAGLAVFVGGVGYFAGPGLSWLLVCSAAGLGNFLNAVFSQTSQPSIGASTAVFAAVGLISIFGIRNYYLNRRLKQRFLISFMAGFGIFAMLGTNPQTDVSAHWFGFVSGALVGVVVLPLVKSEAIRNRVLQLAAFLIFCVLIYGSWYIPAHQLFS